MWQEPREELFLLRHPPFQVPPAMLRYCPQCATPEVTDWGQMRKFFKKKRTRPGSARSLDFAWWPLPELNWGHEDFQS